MKLKSHIEVKLNSLENNKNYLRESGVVVSIKDDFAFVKTQRTTGCSGCSSQSGCGTSALSKLFVREKSEPLKVSLTQPCEVGDEVELLLDESRLLKHSFMAYGLPLIGMFIGALTFNSFAEYAWQLDKKAIELFAVTGAVMGLFLGWKITQVFYKPSLPELGSVLKKSNSSL